MYTRLSKTLLVLAIALFTSLVTLNNLTDYGANYNFVVHVMMMDTTFTDNPNLWRSIDMPLLHHITYRSIIFTEGIVALLCWWSGFRLLRSIGDANPFNQTKPIAIVGLTLGILLWVTGFITIGGEWFLMWQSPTWNGQQAAFRFAIIFGITLVYLVQSDQQDDP